MRIKSGDRIRVFIPKWATGEHSHTVTVQSTDSGHINLVPSMADAPGSPVGLYICRPKKSEE